MKAYKHCTSCGEYTHVVTANKNGGMCKHCNVKFEVKEKVIATATSEEKTVTAWQPGYKSCSTCKKFTKGPRTKICVHCGADFFAKPVTATPVIEEKTTVDEGETESEVEYIEVAVYPENLDFPEHVKNGQCYAPSGECPYRLRANGESTLPSDDAIRTWAHSVRQKELTEKGRYITNDGLFYWASREVNYDLRFKHNSEEMVYLRDFIKGLPDIRTKKVVA